MPRRPEPDDYYTGGPITAALWTSEEAGRFLGLPEKTVRNMGRRGELPTVRLGRTVRFSREALEQWVRDNSQYRTYQHPRAK